MTGSTFETHEVLNQPPPFAGKNLFESDPILLGALEAVLDDPTEQGLSAHGGFWGASDALELARLANVSTPVLRTHDGFGRRLDAVEYHPAYHALMRRSHEAGLAGSLWESANTNEAGRRHALRTARLFMTAQTEASHLWSIAATSAAGAAILPYAEIATEWMPRVLTRRYDHRFLPLADKAGATIGLGLTEKQGGSHLGQTATRAVQVSGRAYRLVGHKWFLSAPMSDAFLILATAPAGPSLFLVPRFLADGSVNPIRFPRIKDKLGNRANATVEAEFEGARAVLIGTEGGGLDALSDTLHLVRFDTAVISAGLMRGATARAVHYARNRKIADERLADQPVMARVLADMAIDTAAATALVTRLAIAFDHAGDKPTDDAYARLVTPAAKYWICKATPPLIAECLECVGGNGYVEDNEMARFFREAPAAGLLAGPGNVLALEVLKVLDDRPEALEVVLAEFGTDLGKDAEISVDVIRGAARACQEDQGSARILIEQLALAAAAAALHKFAPRAITDAFLDTRIAGPWRASYGMLDGAFDSRGIVDYAYHGI